MNLKEMNLNIDNIEKAMSGLWDAFNWASSDEGDGYWREAHHRLGKILELARQKELEKSKAKLKLRLRKKS